MIQNIKQTITTKLDQARSFLVSIGQWIARKCRKHQKKIIGISVSTAVLILLAGLILGSYKFVTSVDQGVPINYTEGIIADSSVSNSGGFVGLNTYYYSVPATKFLVSFRTEGYQ